MNFKKKRNAELDGVALGQTSHQVKRAHDDVRVHLGQALASIGDRIPVDARYVLAAQVLGIFPMESRKSAHR